MTQQKVDEAVLALLALWAFKDGAKWWSWKSFDWAVVPGFLDGGVSASPA